MHRFPKNEERKKTMQKINQKILSLLLALAMVVSLLSPVTNVSWAEDAAGNTELKAGDTVTAGGNYTLSKDIAAGTLLIFPPFHSSAH